MVRTIRTLPVYLCLAMLLPTTLPPATAWQSIPACDGVCVPQPPPICSAVPEKYRASLKFQGAYGHVEIVVEGRFIRCPTQVYIADREGSVCGADTTHWLPQNCWWHEDAPGCDHRGEECFGINFNPMCLDSTCGGYGTTTTLLRWIVVRPDGSFSCPTGPLNTPPGTWSVVSECERRLF